jgi:hypothetical protein
LTDADKALIAQAQSIVDAYNASQAEQAKKDDAIGSLKYFVEKANKTGEDYGHMAYWISEANKYSSLLTDADKALIAQAQSLVDAYDASHSGGSTEEGKKNDAIGSLQYFVNKTNKTAEDYGHMAYWVSQANKYSSLLTSSDKALIAKAEAMINTYKNSDEAKKIDAAASLEYFVNKTNKTAEDYGNIAYWINELNKYSSLLTSSDKSLIAKAQAMVDTYKNSDEAKKIDAAASLEYFVNKTNKTAEDYGNIAYWIKELNKYSSLLTSSDKALIAKAQAMVDTYKNSDEAKKNEAAGSLEFFVNKTNKTAEDYGHISYWISELKKYGSLLTSSDKALITRAEAMVNTYKNSDEAKKIDAAASLEYFVNKTNKTAEDYGHISYWISQLKTYGSLLTSTDKALIAKAEAMVNTYKNSDEAKKIEAIGSLQYFVNKTNKTSKDYAHMSYWIAEAKKYQSLLSDSDKALIAKAQAMVNAYNAPYNNKLNELEQKLKDAGYTVKRSGTDNIYFTVSKKGSDLVLKVYLEDFTSVESINQIFDTYEKLKTISDKVTYRADANGYWYFEVKLSVGTMKVYPFDKSGKFKIGRAHV